MTDGWRRERLSVPTRIVLIAVGAVLIFLSLRAWPAGALRFGYARAPRTGQPAPALEAQTLDGRRLALADLKGQVVLVNFWATWCGPCRTEMPAFEQLWKEHQRDGFVVLGLSADESPGDVVAYVADRSVTYPIAMATATQKRDYAITAFPTSYLVDRHGRVRHQVLGAFPEPLLRQLVTQRLAEPAPSGARPRGS